MRRRGLKAKQYQAYLMSAAWRAKRKEAFALYGRCCGYCGAEDQPLHVHHLTYEHFGEESMQDLRVLCETCHNRAHRSKKKRKKIERTPKAVPAVKVKKNQWAKTHRKQEKERREKQAAAYAVRQAVYPRKRWVG